MFIRDHPLANRPFVKMAELEKENLLFTEKILRYMTALLKNAQKTVSSLRLLVKHLKRI